MSLPYLEFTADSSQQANLAGGHWVVKINCEHIMRPWPAAADIVNGVITKLPVLRVDTGFRIIKPVPGTIQYRFPSTGRHGYQFVKHELNYEVANESELISQEIEKDLNTQAVFIVMKPDGRMIVLGNSIQGLQIQNEGDSGLDGGENKTSVKATSNVQRRRPLFLDPTLEAQIKLVTDGYSLTYTSQIGTLIGIGNTSLTGVNLRDLANVAIGRKFVVNDLIKIGRLDATAYAAGSAVFLPDSSGFITARISAVYNTTGQPVGLIDKIDITDFTFYNMGAMPSLPRPYTIQLI